MQSTYSFIMEYLGGTYISQVVADNEEEAMIFWIQKLDTKEIAKFSKKDKEKIIKTCFVDEQPTSIKGIQNVWYFCVRTKKGFGMINIVKTVD